MTLRTIALAVALALAGGNSAAAQSIRHEPPAGIGRGAPVPVMVTLDTADDRNTLLVHYLAQGQREYQQIELATSDGGYTYQGELPAAATRGLQLRYYIEARRGSESVATAGSFAEPLAVSLANVARPAAGAPPPPRWAQVGAAGAGCGLFLVVLVWRRRSLEHQFWTGTVGPLVAMPPSSAAAALTHLARVHLPHPRKGATKFTRRQLKRKLDEYRKAHFRRGPAKGGGPGDSASTWNAAVSSAALPAIGASHHALPAAGSSHAALRAAGISQVTIEAAAASHAAIEAAVASHPALKAAVSSPMLRAAAAAVKSSASRTSSSGQAGNSGEWRSHYMEQALEYKRKRQAEARTEAKEQQAEQMPGPHGSRDGSKDGDTRDGNTRIGNTNTTDCGNEARREPKNKEDFANVG